MATNTPPTETPRKRSRRTLAEQAEPIADLVEESDLPAAELESLKSEIDGRLGKLEQRVEDGLGNLEKRLQESLLRPPRGGDAAAMREEIASALDDFEKRVIVNLREARSKGDKERAGLLERVLHLLQDVTEAANPQRWKEALARFSLRGKSEVVDDYGMDPVVSERFKPLLDFLYYEYWRVEVKGIQHIPADGAALLVSNHSGALPYDGAMIKTAVKNDHVASRDVRFLVEDFVYHFPFMGTLMMRIGGVRASPENAVRLLRHGQLVCVFPEGVKGLGKLYKQRYQLQRFGRGGFVKICLDTKAPLVPVAVVGAEEIHPMIGRGSWIADIVGVPYLPITPFFPWLGLLGAIPLPSKWTIGFSEPIDFASFDDASRKNRILVNKLSQQVRARIQNMIKDEVRERRSIWFG